LLATQTQWATIEIMTVAGEVITQTIEDADQKAFHHVGRFTAREVLELDFDEPDGVHLLDAPIDVFRGQEEGEADVTEYIAVPDHPPLRQDTLLNFLIAVSPDGEGDSDSAVYYDWVLSADAIHQKDRRLHQAHLESLRRHWLDFEISKRSLMHALVSGNAKFERSHSQQGPNPQRLLRGFEGHLVPTYNHAGSRERLLQTNMDFPTVRRIFKDTEAPDPTLTMAGFMLERGVISERTYQRIAAGNKRKTVSAVFDQDRAYYRGRYFDVVGSEMVSEALGKQYYCIEDEEGNPLYVPRHSLPGSNEADIQHAYRTRRTLYGPGELIGPGRGFSGYVIDQGVIETDQGRRVVYFTSTLRKGGVSALIPVMRWRARRANDGTVQRELITDRYRPESDEVDPAKKLNVIPSNLLGILAVAYFSPELRSKWPKKVGFKGSVDKQSMGAAQVPVLALMQRGKLVESPIVSHMEAMGTQQ
jgi:hypothetical protein